MQRYRPSTCFASMMHENDNGEYVKFADIPLQPVPEPLPWLDQPDGPGAFHEVVMRDGKWKYNGIREFVCRFDNAEKNAKYQRIPQPSLPGDGGNDG